jgi:hypothetical protein
LLRSERYAFACAFCADGFDTRTNLVLPFAKQALGLGCTRVRGGKELGLKTLTMPPPAFLPHIVSG